MCGVCGVIRPSGAAPGDHDLVAALNRLQRHRGPDDVGSWGGDGAVLGQTRLAIVDLTEAGRQPFVSADGLVATVFNGEIYNHEELRDRYRLRTVDRCDGAILPELWTRLGTSMFAELRGMFAIALYDLRTGTATLARDPFGIKPLYWVRTADGALAFASEPRSLLPLTPRHRLNAAAVRHYLRFGAMERDQSPFDGIESVPANGWVQWDLTMACRRGTVREHPFEALSPATDRQLRTGFLDSVEAHLVSDVPVALLLSAGLDSAAIAWACAELGRRLTCVTVDMGPGISEVAGAERVAARFGHAHKVVPARADAGLMRRYFAAMQRPSIDGLNTFVVSRAIAALGVKVALSGLGGDELLAGYPAFRLLRYLPLLRLGDALSVTPLLARCYRAGKPKVADLLGAAGPRDADGLAALVRRVLTEAQVGALAPAAYQPPPPDPPARARPDVSARALSVAELDGYLGGTLLPDADAFSMTWSVELRVPHVDVPFARTALAVAPRRGVGKRGFAAALGDPELRAIARRPKRGFGLPMDDWMRHGPLVDWVHGVEHPDAPVRALLRPEAVDDLVAAWRQGRLSWSRAWLVVSLDAWLRAVDIDVPTLETVPPDGAPQ